MISEKICGKPMFILSLDVEGLTVLDNKINRSKKIMNVNKKVWESSQFILELLERYNLSATWGFTGQLLWNIDEKNEDYSFREVIVGF